ncbi:hypothetical protein PTNB73_09297 [Pyrenophora teres f. teres]|nr:hypothetical protein HRS9139_09520 [Pyrenophora teres f. teres]KAE8827542.1 hypothetical protein PTNB85_08895 [Pyrenophora teres f. teres]KAE8855396.1 hypothetical protein PTNB29_09647 [Pyrenophora teres f. teres]KAE8858049.1 hypothetical protein PTNB73_09297 [Pyrenophora teres f. teres]
MVYIKLLAVTLGLALGTQATNNVRDATVSSHEGSLWETAWPMMHAQIPGIDCSLSSTGWNTTAKKHESCDYIESKLLAIFPGIHCTGQLDEAALLKSLDHVPVSAVQRRETAIARRRNPLDAAIDRDINGKNFLINQQKVNFIQGCRSAPHPGNCYTCVAAAASQALGNGGKCVVAAHLALRYVNARQGEIFTTYAACVGGIVGDLAASAAGCPLRIFESAKTLAFLDIGPLSKGHSLIIPKFHGAKLHDIPDDQLAEVLSVTKRIAMAQKLEDYNILQNNGRIAHQEVDHVHFHLIPKPNQEEGLGIQWPTKPMEKEELSKLLEDIKSKM